MKCSLHLSYVLVLPLILVCTVSGLTNSLESELAVISEYTNAANPRLNAERIDKILDRHINLQEDRLTNQDIFQDISDHYYDKFEFQSGLDYFKLLQTKIPAETELEGELYYHLGRFYNSLHLKKKAESAFDKSLVLIDNSKYTYRIYSDLIRLQSKNNNYNIEKVEQYALKAISLAAQHNASDKEMSNMHKTILSIYISQGNRTKVDYHYLKSKLYANRSKQPLLIQNNALSQIAIYMSTGRFEEGVTLLSNLQASDMLSNSHRHSYFYLKGLTTFWLGDYNNSIIWFEKSLEISTGVLTENIAMSHHWISQAHTLLCQHEEAISHIYSAIKIYNKGPYLFKLRLADNYQLLAHSYYKMGEINKAINITLQSNDYSTKAIYKIYQNSFLIFMYGELLKDEYSPQNLNSLFSVMNDTHHYILEWNIERHFIPDDEIRSFYIRYFYERSLDILYFLYEYTKNPLIGDRIINYSSSLQSLIYHNNKVKFTPFKGSSASKETKQYEKLLKHKVALLKKDIKHFQLDSTETSLESYLSYFDSIEIIKEEYKDFMLINVSNEKKLLSNWGMSNTIMADIQTELETDEAIINYYAAGEYLYSTVIVKDDISIYRKKISSSELKTIKNYKESLSNPDLTDIICFEENKELYTQSAHKLYELLLEDELKNIPTTTKHLIIIADEIIQSLPFKSLLTEAPAKDENYKTFPFLVNNYSVAYEYSLQSLLYHKQKKRKIRENSYVGFAPEYNIAETNNDSIYASLNQDQSNYADFVLRGAFVNLPSAKRSVIDIAKQFKKGRAVTGSHISKDVLKTYSGTADIVHLAMHAVIDIENPDLSQFVFSGQNEELNLYAYDLYDLNMDTELAMLSGCDTGKGEAQSGKSLQSISQAFSLAGASSITMSFYKIPDEHTATIDKYFINNIIKGLRVDEALRQSNLEYIERSSEKYAHPFYWAGIVVAGKTAPIKRKRYFFF